MEKLEGGRGKAVLSWLKWHVQYIYWQGIANAPRKLSGLSLYHWMPYTETWFYVSGYPCSHRQ